eukprot:2364816-Amphidinium_carterae.1
MAHTTELLLDYVGLRVSPCCNIGGEEDAALPRLIVYIRGAKCCRSAAPGSPPRPSCLCLPIARRHRCFGLMSVKHVLVLLLTLLRRAPYLLPV